MENVKEILCPDLDIVELWIRIIVFTVYAFQEGFLGYETPFFEFQACLICVNVNLEMQITRLELFDILKRNHLFKPIAIVFFFTDSSNYV